MAQPAIDLERPQSDQTRTELTLGRIGREWRSQPRGDAFTSALLDFLRSQNSPDTLKSYSFSVLEFFGWMECERHSVPTPERVRRADAIEFVKWLKTRDLRLTKWYLEQDPDRKIDLRIYNIVAEKPGADIDHVLHQLRLYGPDPVVYRSDGFLQRLAHRLACLVKYRTLTRTPSVEEWRKEHGGLEPPPPKVFKYYVPTVATDKGEERSSTIATRLSALSSLWGFMIRSGENAPGASAPLLTHNIWTDLLSQVQAQAPGFRAATREKKTPNLELFLRIFATTFTRTHGPEALNAARAVFFGQPEPPTLRGVTPSFKDLRDRALLLVMATTGARAREIKRMRRQDLASDKPLLTIVGKGGKKRVIMLPPLALRALNVMWTKIELMAKHQERYSVSGRAVTLLGPTAPLLPAVAYWGANSGQREQGLTRPGISLILKRRAETAGIAPDSPLYAKAHPHGLRHLFIKYALETGTPVHRVQAIVGHASGAQTLRYAEEREPDKLIADVFQAPPAPARAMEPEVRPTPTVIATTHIPGPPLAPRPGGRAPKPVATAPRALPERPARKSAALVAPPRTALHGAQEPSGAEETLDVVQDVTLGTSAYEAPTFDAIVHDVERYRKQAITAHEEQSLDKCRHLSDETYRNLCVIYLIHWGEEGNRQPLVSTGGGRKAKAAFLPNKIADFYTDDDLTPERRSGSNRFYASTGTDKTHRIYSGKDSGLSWWTGTQGSLKPEMPVLSPGQFGSCEEGSESTLCKGLVKLWKRWQEESPTKAEALVRWVGEALDTTAQADAVIRSRGGEWVGENAPWEATHFLGNRRAPLPRKTFREHDPEEALNWFTVRGSQYRTSFGDPEGWAKKTAPSKVRDELAPDFYQTDDPVLDLPYDERADFLDWILVQTGQMPIDETSRFGIDGSFHRASRVDVAEFIESMCRFDMTIDELRDQRKHEVASGAARTPGPFWGYESVDEFPVSVRRTFQQLEADVRGAVSHGTGGRVNDFGAFVAIKKRVKGKDDEDTTSRRDTWYLGLVKKLFGAEAAEDEVVRLVAKCGDVPLAEFKQLFRVESGTIRHTVRFKEEFAEAYASHSECVARRIARELWEIKKHSPKSETLTRPRHMMTVVDIMQTFKVPCSSTQEYDLKSLLGRRDPRALQQEWQRAMVSPDEREELSEIEQQERDIAEEHRQARAKEFAAHVLGSGRFERNPSGPAVPTPIHLALAGL